LKKNARCKATAKSDAYENVTHWCLFWRGWKQVINDGVIPEISQRVKSARRWHPDAIESMGEFHPVTY